MEKYVLFGPPGTGKTTYLMKLLKTTLKDTPAERIAFVSFTRQGTYEGVNRAIDEFELNRFQQRYFKTIHALCFANIGATKSIMVGKPHYKLLSEKTGIAFTGYYTEDFTSTNDAYLHALSMRKHNPNYSRYVEKELNQAKLKYIDVQYNQMKKQLGIIDFDDLLQKYLDFGTPLDVDVAFIDEAQDLTLLQWKVVDKLFSNAEVVYVAGDDDQAVYEWAGASVSQFMKFSSNHKVLNHSYRLPKRVWKLAKEISSDIARRKDKEFEPREEKGKVTSASSLSNAKVKEGDLILARTNWGLRELASDFSALGLPYLFKGKPSIDNIVLQAIKAHIKFEKREIDNKAMMKFKPFFSSIDYQPWQNTIDLSKEQINHYENMIGRYENKKPVKFETFHSCKGSENDHVILCPDLSNKVYKRMFKRYDSELRCLYVAMTRTKDKLTVLLPKKKHYYPNRYFGV